MAIKRYSGDHFFGLESDTKPTDVDNGATFDEYDTGTLYHRVNEAWVAFSFSAGSTGDWTFGTGTITGPGAGSLITVGALTLGSSAGNANVIIDPNGTGGLVLNKPSSGLFNIKTSETGGSGTAGITIFPEDGSITYGGGITLYAYAHASKPGMTWIGYGGSLGVSIGLGSDATLGTSRLDIDGVSVRSTNTTTATSTTTGALRSAGGLGIVGAAWIGGLVNIASSLTFSGAFIGGIQALSGAGAVNVTTLTTALTTTGANALTLANGTAGQLKIITHVSDGGDGTLTPTTATGYTTIVFSAVGQSVTLQYHTTLGWMVVSNYGTAIA